MEAKTFATFETKLTSHLARLSDCCFIWHLKPSTCKTVSGCVFHLYNTSASREIEQFLVYLGVTLDRTLSCKEHTTKMVAKLKSRNCLLSKLVGTTWCGSASSLYTSALALCHSVAKYCCPIWARSSYTKLVGSQLNNSMRLISGTLQPIQLHWVIVLLTSLYRKAALDDFLDNVLAYPEWPVYTNIFDHPLQPLVFRCPIWPDMESSNLNEA